MLYGLERFAYRHAAAVSGISDGMMHDLQRKGLPARKRIYFPNWLRQAPPSAVKGEFRRRFNLSPTDFLAVYSGNLGRKQGIDVLVETAQHLANEPITLVIAGAGAEREALAQHVAGLKLPRLALLPLLSDEDYALMLADADVGLITQASGTGQYFFPSKLLSLLQAGLPVATVADADSELAQAVADGGFGLNVLPGHARDLADALGRMAGDAELRKRFRERTQWVQRFNPTVVLPRFARQLEAIAGFGGQPPSPVGEREPSRV
jgi:colanic acid biosynthesis glycosyl transferase WcaI